MELLQVNGITSICSTFVTINAKCVLTITAIQSCKVCLHDTSLSTASINRIYWCRLENEHLNNAGKFRAVKTVPLPFYEVDEDD